MFTCPLMFGPPRHVRWKGYQGHHIGKTYKDNFLRNQQTFIVLRVVKTYTAIKTRIISKDILAYHKCLSVHSAVHFRTYKDVLKKCIRNNSTKISLFNMKLYVLAVL